jgi:hypothetical protein
MAIAHLCPRRRQAYLLCARNSERYGGNNSVIPSITVVIYQANNSNGAVDVSVIVWDYGGSLSIADCVVGPLLPGECDGKSYGIHGKYQRLVHFVRGMKTCSSSLLSFLVGFGA